VVDPGVERAEREQRRFAESGHGWLIRDVTDDRDRLPAVGDDLVRNRRQIVAIARRQDDARAAFRRHPRRAEPDAARGAGDDDYLILESLRSSFLHTSLG